ncbi:hypothetical protein K7432_004062 [Basidiobolus ranarum]|uniref:STIL N-terminal domain-containing protein n=1 Tax=Basidiobolus ranarum TaxID=34480 RepID=A0ABR2W574_9FUNG
MASHTPKSSNGSHYSPRVAPPRPKPLPGGPLISNYASTSNPIPSQPIPRPHPLSQNIQSLKDPILSNATQERSLKEEDVSTPQSCANKQRTKGIEPPELNEIPERTPVRLIRQVTTNLNLINGDLKLKKSENIESTTVHTPCSEGDSDINVSTSSRINSSNLSTDSSPFKIYRSPKSGVVYSFSPENLMTRAIYIGTTALKTAAHHFTEVSCETGFIIGQSEEESNLSVFLDRFDPGKRYGEAENKVPTTLLKEDLLYEIIGTSNETSTSNAEMVQFNKALEELDAQVSYLTHQPSSLAFVFFTCLRRDDGHVSVKCNMLVPNVHFRLRYIKPLKVAESEVLDSLRYSHSRDERIGYTILDNSGSLNIVPGENVKKKQNRIVGLWASNMQLSDSRLVDKIVQYIAWRWERNGGKPDKRPMILLLFNFNSSSNSLDQIYLECLPKMDHPKIVAYSCEKILMNDLEPLRFDSWEFVLDISPTFRQSYEARFGIGVSSCIKKPEFSLLESPKTPSQENNRVSDESYESIIHDRSNESSPISSDTNSTAHNVNDTICEASSFQVCSLNDPSPIDKAKQEQQYAGHTPHPSKVTSIASRNRHSSASISTRNTRSPRVTFASQEELISNEEFTENSDEIMSHHYRATLSRRFTHMTDNDSANDVGSLSEMSPTYSPNDSIIQHRRNVHSSGGSQDTPWHDGRSPSTDMYPTTATASGGYIGRYDYHETPSKSHYNTCVGQVSREYEGYIQDKQRSVKLPVSTQYHEKNALTCKHCEVQHTHHGRTIPRGSHDNPARTNGLQESAEAWNRSSTNPYGKRNTYDEPIVHTNNRMNPYASTCLHCHPIKPPLDYSCTHCRSAISGKSNEHHIQAQRNIHEIEQDRYFPCIINHRNPSDYTQALERRDLENPPYICKCAHLDFKAQQPANVALEETKGDHTLYRNEPSTSKELRTPISTVEREGKRNQYSFTGEQEITERTDLDQYDFYNDHRLLDDLSPVIRSENSSLEQKKQCGKVTSSAKDEKQSQPKDYESRLDFLQQQIDRLQLQVVKSKHYASNSNQTETVRYHHISANTTTISQDPVDDLLRHDVGVNTTIQKMISQTSHHISISHQENTPGSQATRAIDRPEVKKKSRTRIREQRIQITKLLSRVNEILAEGGDNEYSTLNEKSNVSEESDDIYVAEVDSASDNRVDEGIKDRIASMVSNPEESFSLCELDQPPKAKVPKEINECHLVTASQSVRKEGTVNRNVSSQKKPVIVRDIETQTSQVFNRSVLNSRKDLCPNGLSNNVVSTTQEQVYSQTKKSHSQLANLDSEIFIKEVIDPTESYPNVTKDFSRHPTLRVRRLATNPSWGSHDAVDRIVNRYLRG